MSIAVTSYNNTIDNNILQFTETTMTSQSVISKVRITILVEERSHILTTKLYIPILSSLDDITRTDQFGLKMREIEVTNC